MAHITKDGHTLVDWQTGDPEGDRVYLFKAYRSFLNELKKYLEVTDDYEGLNLFERWSITELNIDDFPRIGIKYPEDWEEDGE